MSKEVDVSTTDYYKILKIDEEKSKNDEKFYWSLSNNL